MCSRKQAQFSIPALQLATCWANAEKAFASSFKKWVNSVIKRYALVHKRKTSQIFMKTSVTNFERWFEWLLPYKIFIEIFIYLFLTCSLLLE